MLMPKRVKHRKQFRGRMTGKALRGNKITNGDFGIVAMEPAWIKSNQIEAARIAMTRYIKRGTRRRCRRRNSGRNHRTPGDRGSDNDTGIAV